MLQKITKFIESQMVLEHKYEAILIKLAALINM